MGNSGLTIVFVYNADSGFFNALTDYAHKIISPDTYSCNLCAITYDNMGMKQEWKKFIDNLNVPVEFLHRDEFLKRYHLKDIEFPSAFVKKEENITLLITHTDIDNCKSMEDLMNLVRKKV